MIRAALWAFFWLPLTALAGVVQPHAQHFTTTGSLQSFSWQPLDYSTPKVSNPFHYDIFYYIPEQLRDSESVKALVFNHGGGPSTRTREGSIEMVKRYTSDLMKLADELGIVVVLPSANGLNWGGHTLPFMRSLVKLMRSELNLDADRIGLSGHSMGGMGITRSFPWLADQFSFLMPQAAGLDLAPFPTDYDKELLLSKTFNVPYLHLQGTRDSFPVFVTHAKTQQLETRKLEQKFGLKSKFQLFLYDTDHQYQYGVFKEHLQKAFQSRRNLYQRNLFGTTITDNRFVQENGIFFRYRGSPRYFWVEARGATLSEPERLDFRTHITGNRIEIELDPAEGMSISAKRLRLYLRQGMVDLRQDVSIVINGKLAGVHHSRSELPPLQNFDSSDPGFKFHVAFDVRIPEEDPFTILSRRIRKKFGWSE